MAHYVMRNGGSFRPFDQQLRHEAIEQLRLNNVVPEASGHGQTTVSRNDSDQRRALLLPQEFKELGRDRLVVICENCKPILGQKIRYHDDRAFTQRLLPASRFSMCSRLSGICSVSSPSA
jgi:hypothetical protein